MVILKSESDADKNLKDATRTYDEFTDKQYTFINRISVGAITSYVVAVSLMYRTVHTSPAGEVMYSFGDEQIRLLSQGVLLFVASIALFRFILYLIAKRRMIDAEEQHATEMQNINKRSAGRDEMSRAIMQNRRKIRAFIFMQLIYSCQIVAWALFACALIVTANILLTMASEIKDEVSESNNQSQSYYLPVSNGST